MGETDEGAAAPRSTVPSAGSVPPPAASPLSPRGHAPTISNLLSGDRPSFSFEFFPPKTDEGERAAVDRRSGSSSRCSPTFVSVTYGAGGSTRDRTIRVTERIAHRDDAPADGPSDGREPFPWPSCGDWSADSPVPASATCSRCAVTHPVIRRVSGCSTPRASCTPSELVRLVRALGDFCVGRRGVPGKASALAPTWDSDARHFVAKVRRRCGLRDHPDVLRRRRLLAVARARRPAGLPRPDHPGRHAGDERWPDRADGAAVGRGFPGGSGRAVARGRRRSNGGAGDRRRGSHGVVAQAAGGGRARHPLHHAEPLDRDAGDLRAARSGRVRARL